MGSIGDEVQAYDSVIASQADGGAAINTEPLVLDFATMHDGHTTHQNPPLTPPHSQNASQDQDSWLTEDQDSSTAPAPPDFTGRGIHIPSRTSSSTPAANKRRLSLQRRLSSDVSSLNMPATPEPQSQYRSPSRTYSSNAPSFAPRTVSTPRNLEPTPVKSSADSTHSYDSSAPSVATQPLAPLQQRALDDDDRLSPLLEDDPQSWDLVAPVETSKKQYSLEHESEQLFSRQHLQAIFDDTPSLLRFTTFLTAARPKSVPRLIYYLDALKAIRAINYANAVAEALEPIEGLEFTNNPARATVNAVLEEKANQAFNVLVRDDLPAYITHVFTQVVSVNINRRVTGNMPVMQREFSEGLAEVFCLTDPSRTDNPIIFASEEFHRTTQYGVNYAIGRNCRFLQGPKTNRSSVARFKETITTGKEHSEVFLNYRRDGSPFMNLLMTAPLLDSRGTIRYFIGAQIDISGLVKDGTNLDAFARMRARQENPSRGEQHKDEFKELSEMFNHAELDMVKRHGGNMHREQADEGEDGKSTRSRGSRQRVLIHDDGMEDGGGQEGEMGTGSGSLKPEGRLSGPYKHYLLIRPAPSLRVLFTSPSLRVPGILQSHFLDRIGGSSRVRESVGSALADGSRGVTAKIRWLSRAVSDLSESYEEGRPRWIHCTPLLGSSGAVGVWMVVLVDEEKYSNQPVRRFRQAPPVAHDVRSKKTPTPGGGGYFDDFDGETPGSTPRSGSFVHALQGHGPGAARHVAVDALRRDASPRYGYGNGGEQRAGRSAGSSIRSYATNGHNGSVDTFNI